MYINILFFYIIFFTKMTYLKNEKKFVHSYSSTKNAIYLFDIQHIKTRTKFVLNCTFRTKFKKMHFCTKFLKSTRLVRI